MTDDTLDMTVRYPRERIAIVSVAGDVDLHTGSTLRGRVLSVVDRGIPHIVLDLAGVDYVDSTGLSTFIGLLHSACEADGSLSLAAVPGRLMRMLTMTGISELLPIHDTVDAALAGRTADGSPGSRGAGLGTSA
ncbi:STAS domain-containing protein [Streptomyces orinoci]|uniref:Anti-sigma factor antagonist n=1 Tax=Streptomyces orinoci TaxID=67339 RepID=A0ABV3JZN9_STRON|nr:STAS domain-containing protein [Streptomyces orinoci]